MCDSGRLTGFTGISSFSALRNNLAVIVADEFCKVSVICDGSYGR